MEVTATEEIVNSKRFIFEYPDNNHDDAQRCRGTLLLDLDALPPGSCEHPPQSNGPNAGNPINCATGQKVQIETDYLGNGLDALSYVRQYSTSVDEISAPRWRVMTGTPSLRKKVYEDGAVLYTFTDGGTQVVAVPENSDDYLTSLIRTRRYIFVPASGGMSISPFHDPITLVGEGASIRYQGKTYNFGSSNGGGSSVSVSNDEEPTVQRYTYQYVNINDTTLLSRIENRFGRFLQFEYDAEGQLSTLTDQDGTSIHYEFDAIGNLIKVIYPDSSPLDLNDNPNKQYLFENSDFPQHLTGIMDENGTRYATFTYNETGKAISTEHVDGAERVEVSYPAVGQAIVKFFRDVAANAYREEHYTFGKFRGRYRITTKEITQCDNCDLTTESWNYNADELLVRHTSPAGIITEWTYDEQDRKVSETVGVGIPEARTTTYIWNDEHNQIEQIRTVSEATTNTFDASGNIVRTKVISISE
ncbi:putative rhs-related protein [Reinekea sp. MED297]|uniref:Putative rhs-related protein n=2 Tax=Reinekea TaxID=230494 RepID=A4B8X4_9GAMM|nr:putative rhs-related protein [Reinekea sp. MED297] [Reinekea blandensis MED297]